MIEDACPLIEEASQFFSKRSSIFQRACPFIVKICPFFNKDLAIFHFKACKLAFQLLNFQLGKNSLSNILSLAKDAFDFSSKSQDDRTKSFMKLMSTTIIQPYTEKEVEVGTFQYQMLLRRAE